MEFQSTTCYFTIGSHGYYVVKNLGCIKLFTNHLHYLANIVLSEGIVWMNLYGSMMKNDGCQMCQC